MICSCDFVLIFTGVSIVKSSRQFGTSWQTNARTGRLDQELLRFVSYFQYTILLKKKYAMNDLVMTAKTIVQDQNQSNLFWPIRANVKGVLDQSEFEAKQATNDRRSPEVGGTPI